MSLEQTPEQASYAAQMAKRERWQARLALSRAWQNLGVPLRDAIRASDQAERERLFSTTPHLRTTYDVWVRCRRAAGESTATKQTRRVEQYSRRAKALQKIAPHDRDLPDAELRLKYPAEAEVLRDVAWRLAALRGAPQGLVDWRDTDKLPKLRKWVKRLTQKLFDARMAGQSDAAAQLTIELQRVQDKYTALELDEYDQRLRLWQTENAGIRPRPRGPRTNRKLTRGSRLGRPPNAPGYHEIHAPHRPRRPQWLLEEERAAERERIEQTRMKRSLCAQVAIEARENKALINNWIISERSEALRKESKVDRLASHVHALLDWAWGEGRRMHIGEEIGTEQGTWLYIDDAHGVPRSTTPSRAAALAACAVRLSTGWAFPPETARGRQ